MLLTCEGDPACVIKSSLKLLTKAGHRNLHPSVRRDCGRECPLLSQDASGRSLMDVNSQHFKNALEIARRGREEPAFSEECRNVFRQIVVETLDGEQHVSSE